jgi:DNA-directed RNA polymerase specialized sigma24 family protein
VAARAKPAEAEESPFDAADARNLVEAGLAGLTPRQRAALILTDLLGYRSEDAAGILGVKAVTARVLASQARASMRATIGDVDG